MIASKLSIKITHIGFRCVGADMRPNNRANHLTVLSAVAHADDPQLRAGQSVTSPQWLLPMYF